VTGPVAPSWSTGFEQGLCDYYLAQGFCYVSPPASYEIVDSPVHAGAHAAAFAIEARPGNQARCAREGVLPTDAYYGAWYYIPELHDDLNNWNLIHFQGGMPGGTLDTLWDVDVERWDDDTLHLYVFGNLATASAVERPTDSPPIPIGSWFHIEFLLRRRTDMTGEVALYQNGNPIMNERGIRTETTSFQQWYVGNLANSLTPPASTVYVDDITIRPAP